MHVRGGSQWQSRRKPSLGPLRRAHPASGATWNVQVVRGKMTSRCLWHACRALALGIVLMLVGGGMATVGYYANNFPSLSDVKSNSTSTIRVKNEQRGLHLNNLSYVGPIIMGVGGFIVVASCVMTFEARDSAAKVVPARFKLSSTARNTSRRSTSTSNGPTSAASQSARWEQHLGVFRTSPAVEQVPDRKALTAALVHFSRALGTPKVSHQPSESRRVSRSGSEPNLTDKLPVPLTADSPARSVVRHHRGSRVSSMVHRSTRETNGSLLHPGISQLHRHAQSVDEPEPFARNLNQSGSHGSVHLGYPNDIPVVHKLRERNKRSDTARRHVLSRQTKIEKEEPASPKHNPFVASRRSSTISDASSRVNRSSRRASTVSKTPSVDSRGAVSTAEVNSPALTPRRAKAMQPMSTPSVERECRSQLSICSEPAVGPRNLSCQSSLEPCVPEEDSPEQEESQPCIGKSTSKSQCSDDVKSDIPARPDSLILNGRMVNGGMLPGEKANRFLYRSNSTKSFRKPKAKIKSKKLSNEFDQIFVISSSITGNESGEMSMANDGSRGRDRYPNFNRARDDEYYDSIEVIHERRSKNFNKFNSVVAGDEVRPVEQQREEPGQDVVTRRQVSDEGFCPVGESLGSNKFSVVADISPAVANLHTGSPEKLLPGEEAGKTIPGDDVTVDSGGGATDVDEDEESERKQPTDHNSSIQRYDTVIYNAASSSVESEETVPTSGEGYAAGGGRVEGTVAMKACTGGKDDMPGQSDEGDDNVSNTVNDQVCV
ncbi:uncharacterized protein LOC131687304 isoform X2 [Topomyia yanbarensis]|uniref:uncharacterized protein LOC131687304 isoform X2 n=1 Tax=Topomyia yanbarensis TaxID=2498891 RepID=UPI00273B415A|nr:uncharacterized protein LOC131687304 isoform X2 [Topomyia yanbarensis]